MSYIEKLIEGVIKKGIGAKPKLGDYSIDLEYVKKGVEYTLKKSNKTIAVIKNHVTDNNIFIEIMPDTKGQEVVNIHTAVKNGYPDAELNMVFVEENKVEIHEPIHILIMDKEDSTCVNVSKFCDNMDEGRKYLTEILDKVGLKFDYESISQVVEKILDNGWYEGMNYNVLYIEGDFSLFE